MKKTLLIILVAILVVTVFIFIKYEKNVSTNTMQHQDVFVLHQDIGNIANKELPHLPKIQEKEENALTKKLGTPVTNDLGVPDVWIDIVANNIPESNVKARKAALMLFYYKTQMLLADNQEDILNNSYKWSAAFDCTNFYLTNQTENKQFFKLYVNNYPSAQIKSLSHKVDNNLGGHVISDNFGSNIPKGMEPCDYFINNAGSN